MDNPEVLQTRERLFRPCFKSGFSVRASWGVHSLEGWLCFAPKTRHSFPKGSAFEPPTVSRRCFLLPPQDTFVGPVPQGSWGGGCAAPGKVADSFPPASAHWGPLGPEPAERRRLWVRRVCPGPGGVVEAPARAGLKLRERTRFHCPPEQLGLTISLRTENVIGGPRWELNITSYRHGSPLGPQGFFLG